MIDWQPIDTAPKDGSYVLIADAEHVTVGFYQSDTGETLIAGDNPHWEPFDHSYWNRLETDDSWFQPTHWAPLPDPPVQSQSSHPARPSQVAK